MITFEQARAAVEGLPDAGPTEPYGYESPSRWFPVLAPQRIGGRVPGVDKQTGAVTWMFAADDEYQDAALVGQRP